ncbi:MAG TPA: hypothetical protein VH105_01245 [Burkholderiales bacterium]|jgi:hypothetical protein|nr:hypothetical protein [Burkholderiales bacterium]
MRYAIDPNCTPLANDEKIEKWLKAFVGPSVTGAAVMVIGIRGNEGSIYRVITTTAPGEFQACVRFLQDELGLVDEFDGQSTPEPGCDAIFRKP